MSREIKFRAWDSIENYMISHREIMLGGRIRYSELFKTTTKVVPLQYTGLKDKNNVEIYEGDILKAKRHNFETYELCVIVYKPLCFLFEVQLEDKKYYAPRNYHQHYEVIGNIYENHELLERII